MKTLHVNYVDESGRVYCFRHDEIVELNVNFFTKACMNCPYLQDTAGMMGVECLFDDACNEDAMFFLDSAESEKHSKYALVRLGVRKKAEIDAVLQGSGAEESTFEELYPEEKKEEKKVETP